MGDLISRQNAIDAWDKLSKRGRTEFDQVLMTLPSAELKTGHWTLKPMLPNIHRYECSVCNSHHRARYDFCPSCGSRIIGGDGEEE